MKTLIVLVFVLLIYAGAITKTYFEEMPVKSQAIRELRVFCDVEIEKMDYSEEVSREINGKEVKDTMFIYVKQVYGNKEKLYVCASSLSKYYDVHIIFLE